MPTVGEDKSATRQRTVVVLAELRNFTHLSDVLGPGKVSELVSEFFSLVARVVEAREGEVFAGRNDSIVAAFRRGAATRFAGQALAAAQTIQREFAALAESWESSYGVKAGVALGLHLGDAVFGTIGPVNDRRRAVFGDTVTVAERLAHRARAREFVLSEVLYDTLAGAGLSLEAAEELPALELAHQPPISIYGVMLDTRLDFT